MSSPINLTEQNIAISGYDPVSYFVDEPQPGNPDITATHGEATYYFVNAENKAKFEADPEAYVPQYGGFCAVAASDWRWSGFEIRVSHPSITNHHFFL